MGVDIAETLVIGRSRNLLVDSISQSRFVELPGSVLDPTGADHFLVEAGEIPQSVVLDLLAGEIGRPLLGVGTDAWRSLFDAVVTTGFWLTRALCRRLSESGGGAIVFVGSDAAADPRPSLSTDTVIYAALRSMASGAALDMAPLGVRICMVSLPVGASKAQFATVGEAISFCVSDRASYVLGSNFSPYGSPRGHEGGPRYE